MEKKSPDAFRTISEVAEWLDTPAHVLRFWESRFSQVKPVKRAGGRRYYRPSDMVLLGGIKKLLHEDGMTIRGVQKILRDQGVRHVAALSQELDLGAVVEGRATPAEDAEHEAPMRENAEVEQAKDNVVPLTPAAPEAPPEPEAEPPAPEQEPVAAPESEEEPEVAEEPQPSTELPHEPEPMPEEASEEAAFTDEAEGATEIAPRVANAAADGAEPPAPPEADQSQGEMSFDRRAPLGAGLPQEDPADDALPLGPRPLTARLRDRAVRRDLRQNHGPAVAEAVTRLKALSARIADGA